MSCTTAVCYWGKSASVPITDPQTLQHTRSQDDPYATYDFSDLAGSGGFPCIAIPVSVGLIRSWRYNDSPIDYLPITDSVSVVTSTGTLIFNIFRTDAPLSAFDGLSIVAR